MIEKQIIIHHLDWFTKIILLFITVILLGLLLKPIIQPKLALGTSEQRINVNLDRIGGHLIGLEAIPIKIKD